MWHGCCLYCLTRQAREHSPHSAMTTGLSRGPVGTECGTVPRLDGPIKVLNLIAHWKHILMFGSYTWSPGPILWRLPRWLWCTASLRTTVNLQATSLSILSFLLVNSPPETVTWAICWRGGYSALRCVLSGLDHLLPVPSKDGWALKQVCSLPNSPGTWCTCVIFQSYTHLLPLGRMDIYV